MGSTPIPKLTTIEEARFWNHVKIGSVDECWPWKAALDRKKYGLLTLRRRPYRAHRIAYKLKRGDPGNLNVLHSCDYRRCCNPKHLFKGTLAKNNQDAAQKDRSPNAKLKVVQVRTIRKLLSLNRFTQAQIAQLFNVSDTTIGHISSGYRWSHLR